MSGRFFGGRGAPDMVCVCVCVCVCVKLALRGVALLPISSHQRTSKFVSSHVAHFHFAGGSVRPWGGYYQGSKGHGSHPAVSGHQVCINLP